MSRGMSDVIEHVARAYHADFDSCTPDMRATYLTKVRVAIAGMRNSTLGDLPERVQKSWLTFIDEALK